MKSLKRVLLKIQKRNPLLSDYLCFAETLKGRTFARATIRKHFNELVDKDDYSREDKRSILKHLYNLSMLPAE